jgi:para-nitrobenzyl esterase
MRLSKPKQRKSRICAIALFVVFTPAIYAQEPPSTTVTGGKIRGDRLNAAGAVFKGIPFAAPPVGELRWRETNPVKPWVGVRDATVFGSRCMQTGNNVSEDCLYLNVWTPEWPVKSRRPVMLWIPGGGKFAGSSSDAVFDGQKFADRGVVLVSANYREPTSAPRSDPSGRSCPRHDVPARCFWILRPS